MGEASLRNAKMTKALGELLRLARAGKLHGFAYASIIEDADGDLSGGCNAIWDGNEAVHRAMSDVVGDLAKRLEPKKSILLDATGSKIMTLN